MNFLNICKVSAITEFKLKLKKKLELPGQNTPTVHDWWGPGHVTYHGGFDCGQNHRRGRGGPGRRPVRDNDGDSGLPRGCAWARWEEDAEANLMVVAPLRCGHRSLAGGDVPRRRSRMNGETLLRGATEQSGHVGR
jgi:hypothetical protein